jgi:hypothetical protein
MSRINPPLTRIVAVSWKGCVPGSLHLSNAAEFGAQRVSRLRLNGSDDADPSFDQTCQ